MTNGPRDGRPPLSPAKQLLLERRLRGVRAGSGDTPAAVPASPAAVRRPDRLPLSYAQEHLWVAHQLRGRRGEYNLCEVLRLRGDVDLEALDRTVQAIVARHEILRTTFAEIDGTACQVVAPTLHVPVPIDDLRSADEQTRAAAVRAAIARERDAPFDLARGPLLRVRVLRLGDTESVLLRTVHHIVTDGWSEGVFNAEWLALYAAFRDGRADPLPPLVLQYGDYSAKQRETLTDAVLAPSLEYWTRQLAALPARLDIPTDRPRAGAPAGAAGVQTVSLSPSTLTALKQVAQREHATTFMMLLGALAVLLARYSGEEDVFVASPVANRPQSALEGLIGFFVNTLLLRVRLSLQWNTAQLLGAVRRVTLDAYEHQHVPYERVLAAAMPQRDSLVPLGQVVFALQNMPLTPPQLAGLQVERLADADATCRTELDLSAWERDDRLHVRWTYSRKLFDEWRVRQMADHFVRLIEAMIERPDAAVGRLDLLSAAERRTVLEGWNATAHAIPPATLHGLIEAHAAERPDAIALVFRGAHVSYREMQERANRIAHAVRVKGAGPESLVGVAVERSPETILAILGVLKAGAAYVPLDTDLPVERLAYMIDDAAVRVLVTTTAIGGRLARRTIETIAVDDDQALAAMSTADPSVQVRPEHAAYVIYTSGSTGAPKGVVVTHAGLRSLALTQQTYGGASPASRVLQFTSFGFDGSVGNLTMSLASGATMVMVEPEARAGPALGDAIRRNAVTHASLPPAVLATVPADRPLPLATLVVAGESCPADLAATWSGRTRMINAYGPTEATVGATWSAPLGAAGTPPIGRPIYNTRVYVLDARLEPVPVGVTGELYIGGPRLARGYLHRRALTAARFVADPYGPPSARLYRTGDLARFRPDGNVEFLGRVDHQLKIRGCRVEPGEIEAALRAWPSVRDALVILRHDPPAAAQLVAYVVGRCDVTEVDRLRQALARQLPAFMVPAAIVALDRWPVNANGKIDVPALPPPTASAGPRRLPSTAQEELLCRLVSSVLGVDTIGVDDNFFAAGGDSIRSIQVVSRARDAGLAITPRDIFEHQTVAALAAIATPIADATPSSDTADDSGAVALTPTMRRWLDRDGSPAHFTQSMAVRVPASVREAHVVAAVADLLEAHDALRLQLRRPAADGDWMLEVLPIAPVAASSVRRVAVDDLDPELRRLAVADARRAAVARIAPEAGIMLQAVWFDAGPQTPGELLLVVHHFAVDAVSWPILWRELRAACDAAARDAAATRPASRRSSSFRQWAALLAREASAESRQRELTFWTATLAGADPLVAGSLDPRRDVAASAGHHTLVLPPATAGPLLGAAPGAFRAQVLHVLSAALAVAVSKWKRRRNRDAASALLVDLERHGREDIFPGVDLSNTVGWFTTVHPACFDLGGIDVVDAAAGGPALVAALKRVKEQLNAVHDGGIGYGLLRYGNAATAAVLSSMPTPQLAFNYLGRFAASTDAEWTPAGDTVLEGHVDPQRSLGHAIELIAVAVDTRHGPELRASWSWAPTLLTEEDVRELATCWFEVLEHLTARAAQRAAGGLTPSDVPLVPLTQAQIDRLETRHGALDDVLPLSPLQHGLLFHALFDGTAPDVYVVQVVLRLDGDVDERRLRSAAQALMRRHAALRASFDSEDPNGPVQVIASEVSLAWHDVDLAASSEPEREVTERLAADRLDRFEVARAPLIRFQFIRLAARQHRFVLTYHHLLLDGWSLPVLLQELWKLYEHDGADDGLPRVTPLRDYFAWLARQDAAVARDTWRAELADLDEPTRVAGGDRVYDQAMPEALTATLSTAITTRLEHVSRGAGLTLSTVVQGACGVLIARLAGRDDVVFGTTVAGRPPIGGVERMVGLFINTVPVRVRIRPGQSLHQLLRALQDQQTRMMPYHHVRLSDLPRVGGASDLFDTLVVFENYPVDRAGLRQPLPGVRVSSAGGGDATHYPLTIEVVPGEALALRVAYRTDLYERATIEAIVERLIRLLEIVAGGLDQIVDRIVLADVAPLEVPAERDRPAVRTLQAAVETQAAAMPDAIAIAWQHEALSYAALNRQANRLAQLLIGRGIGPEDVVAVALDRTPQLVVAFLAILKAGAAYLPLDVDYPETRLRATLDDAGPSCLLTTTREAHRFGWRTDVVCLDSADTQVASSRQIDRDPTDADRVRTLHAHHRAYLLYTSGSTGIPKGVAIEHRSAVTLVDWALRTYSPADLAVVLVSTSASFDLSVFEMFVPLAAGGALVIADHVLAWPSLPQAPQITLVNTVPSALAELLNADAAVVGGVRTINLAGEVLSRSLVDDVHRRGLATWVFNLYGPTESTTYSTSERLVRDERGAVPIGRPISGTHVYVLDRHLDSTPVGVIGELYISGAGLARGYVNRRGGTAERFVADPSGPPGARMYRTGDLGRRRADGRLDVVGRADSQVKVSGFRIECGDVESALVRCRGVGQAAVIVRDDAPGPKRLVAYVVPSADQTLDVHAVRRDLAQLLPHYMLPQAIVAIARWPLTDRGKLDRRALPAPERGRPTGGRPPATTIERTMCALVAEVLRVERAGLEDNFFELGGDSILALRLVSLARQHGVTLRARDVFQHATVEALAAVAQPAPAITRELEPPRRFAATPIMRWLLARGGPIERFSQSWTLDLAPGTRETWLVQAIQAVVDHHDALRLRLMREAGEDAIEIAPRGTTSPGVEIRRVDVEGLSADERSARVVAETRAAAARLDPAAGVVLQAIWFVRGGDESSQLRLLVHHLAVDGVSWRILVPDLQQALEAVAASRPVHLMPTPTAFGRWAEWLAIEARRSARAAELPFWTDALRAGATLVRGRLDPRRDTAGTARHLPLSLAAPLSTPLVASVPARFHARVDDILLTALAVAVARWRRQRHEDAEAPILVELERHGREPIGGLDADVTRTVGWFTTLHPVRLDAGRFDPEDLWTRGAGWSRLVKRIKEQVHAAPDGGLGYGLLRYLNDDTRTVLSALDTPQVAFNYLGRFAALNDERNESAESPMAGAIDETLPLAHVVEITVVMLDRADGPQLKAHWSWAPALVSEPEVRELAGGWLTALGRLIAHAAEPGAGGRTPSDFALVGLTQEEIEGLEEGA